MQYILTKNGQKLPFYNSRKIFGEDNNPRALELTFLLSEIQSAEFDEASMTSLMKDSDGMKEFSAYNESDVLLNTYYQYNRLDEVSYKYNFTISQQNDDDAMNLGTEPDTMITVTLLKQSELEVMVKDTNEAVDAMAVAMAEILGGV